MSEQIIEPPTDKPSRLQAIWQNPVTMKELRSRMRGRRAFVVLTVYLFIMSGFITLVYAAFASASRGPFGPDPRDVGKVIFASVLGIQAFLVTFVAPAFTAGAITGEKERQTYDLLRTTLLSANWFVTGKLVSALSYVFLLIFAAIPLQSIAFLLGGVVPIELFLSQVIIIISAVAFALYGLYCSSIMRSTLSASVLTFAGTLFITIGIPMLVGLFSAILSPIFALSSALSPAGQAFLIYSLLVLAATNLPATLIVSDVFLIEEGALFYFRTPIPSGGTAFIFSPWPLFILFYILLALLLYWACVRRVRKIATK